MIGVAPMAAAEARGLLFNGGAYYPIASTASPTLGFTFAEALADGESVADPETVLWHLEADAAYDDGLDGDPGGPDADGMVTQALHELARFQHYRLDIRFRRAPGSSTDVMSLLIVVPY